jgi:hypothetical protein
LLSANKMRFSGFPRAEKTGCGQHGFSCVLGRALGQVLARALGQVLERALGRVRFLLVGTARIGGVMNWIPAGRNDLVPDKIGKIPGTSRALGRAAGAL